MVFTTYVTNTVMGFILIYSER